MTRQQKTNKILNYVRANPGQSQKAIASGALGSAKQQTVNPIIRELVARGQLEERGAKGKRSYYISGPRGVAPIAVPPGLGAPHYLPDPHDWRARIDHALMLFIAAHKLTLPSRWPL